MALVAVAAGHPDQLEAVPGLVVGVGQPLAELLDGGHRQLQELGQQVGRHRVGGHEHDGLDGPHDVGRIAPVGRRVAARRASVSSKAGSSGARVEELVRVGHVSPRSRRWRRRRPAPTRRRRRGQAARPASASRCRRRRRPGRASTRPCLNSSSSGQEADDDLQPLDQPVGQAAEGDAADPGQLVDQLGHRLGHRQPDGGDVGEVDLRHRPRASWPAGRRRRTSSRRDALQQVRRQGDEALLGPDPAGERARGLVGQAAQHAGRVLERLALEEAGQQQVALLPQGQLLVEVDVLAVGQQPAGLQLDQRGGDEQELRGHVEIEGLHPLHLDQVGVDDPGQRDLVEVDLLPQDQVQQQVERALVDLGRHLVRHGSRVPADTLATAASRVVTGLGRVECHASRRGPATSLDRP